ncbi:acetylornithine and succinylornithine aminotransferase [Desulfofarcimen acetoxidans DSM 771]|uniref:Acetylornithine aminotransferase n=1 Tax=Desulfofarcimen acetoxidans (strain ATCC 49208 / DSM 771 / KCTC 5769 / VKM B-1644 / 5575) TaxID=485916 RepID=C8W634_DESAS|nr:acetylornithine transaminase [Desulfofarcimen acetoxidans]ACV61489.1 acetylornithine and succinylornithine aminotransferase [Desulfofarcimen acetoxidans DSM 771]
MNNQEIIEVGGKYVMNTYGRLPMALVKGEGVKVWDADGNEYLDFIAGLAVNSLGHCHPAVTEAIARQACALMHCSNIYWIEPQVKLARLLAENSDLDKVFFCNSGAEANEGAIKLARKYAKQHLGSGKYEIITALNSFHGRTLAAITATGQAKYQQGLEPLPAGFKYVPFGNIEALKEAVGPHTCAVMLEPVQGEGGVNLAAQEYWNQVQELCSEEGLLLILDEVQCGLGRTGKFLAYMHYGLKPDIVTLAKALGGGFPIGAMMAVEKVASAFQPGDHAATFGGNPLASAAALAAMNTMLNEGIILNAEKVGNYFKHKLTELAAKYPVISEVRGLGLMLGAQLTVPGADIVSYCQQKGLLINCANGNVLRFIPPLIITESDVDKVVNLLDEALGKIEKRV